MSLIKLHPKIEETLQNPNHGTILDGAFATQAFDTSAEMVDIAGTDISSLNEDGIVNTEHQNPENKKFIEASSKDASAWGTIVGRIIFAKKVFGEQDCESERELILWNLLLVPFIYGAVELFDAEGHENAKELAAIIKHYHRRGLPVVVRYSIEGSTIERNGQHLTRTIARRVAATIKPCNKSSYNYLVAEAAPPKQLDIEKNETGISPYISVFEMEYDPCIELNKTLTLGSYNADPGQLTGGSALQIEDVGKRKEKEFIKSQVLAAFRDWDKITPFRDFLKHRLPDADDKFVDKFMHIADEIKLTKGSSEVDNLKKSPYEDSSSTKELAPLNSKPPSGAKLFRNKFVIPGEVELISGPYQGNKLKLLHLDDKHAYIQALKAGDQDEIKINKLSRNHEGSHFIISKPPEELSLPNHVHGDKHADPGLTESHEQKELMHGIDLAQDNGPKPYGATNSRMKPEHSIGWFKSGNGKMGYVKPSIELPQDSMKPGDEHYIPTAKRETIFHNVAKNYFGLGEYVPTTASFKHPNTDHDHSVMEQVPFAEHVQIKNKDHQAKDHLMQAGDSGQLDKMAVMDMVMGNVDRNRLNYLTSPNHPHVHLIDNALLFNEDSDIPGYIHDYHHFKGENSDTAHMHPDSLKWLVKLDPFELGAELTKQGVHPKLANQAVSRLLSMQSNAVLGKTKKHDILFAHSRFMDSKMGAA